MIVVYTSGVFVSSVVGEADGWQRQSDPDGRQQRPTNSSWASEHRSYTNRFDYRRRASRMRRKSQTNGGESTTTTTTESDADGCNNSLAGSITTTPASSSTIYQRPPAPDRRRSLLGGTPSVRPSVRLSASRIYRFLAGCGRGPCCEDERQHSTLMTTTTTTLSRSCARRASIASTPKRSRPVDDVPRPAAACDRATLQFLDAVDIDTPPPDKF